MSKPRLGDYQFTTYKTLDFQIDSGFLIIVSQKTVKNSERVISELIIHQTLRLDWFRAVQHFSYLAIEGDDTASSYTMLLPPDASEKPMFRDIEKRLYTELQEYFLKKSKRAPYLQSQRSPMPGDDSKEGPFIVVRRDNYNRESPHYPDRIVMAGIREHSDAFDFCIAAQRADSTDDWFYTVESHNYIPNTYDPNE